MGRKTISIEEAYPSWFLTGGPGGQQDPPPPPGTGAAPLPQDTGSEDEPNKGISARVGLIAGLSSAAAMAVLMVGAAVLRRMLVSRRVASSDFALGGDESGIIKDHGVEASQRSSKASVDSSSKAESSRADISIPIRSHENLSKISTLSKVRLAATSPLMLVVLCYWHMLFSSSQCISAGARGRQKTRNPLSDGLTAAVRCRAAGSGESRDG